MPVTPPRPKGPALNALRAFEAAARLGSFAQAAEELTVTSGAISQHIRTLEDWAGVALFERRAQGVRLTAAGRRLLPPLTTGFDALGSAVRSLRDMAPQRGLSIAALPSVAQLWLQPRLSAFRAAFPGISLQVTVAETPPNLERELFDLTLFIRPPAEAPGGVALAMDTLVPVCAPDFGIRSAADLETLPRLHDASWHSDWSDWAAATDTPLSSPDAGPRFSLYAMAVEEAKAGAGVLIGHTALLDRDLGAGKLIAPLDLAVPTGQALLADVAPGPLAKALRALLADLAG